MLPVIHLSTLAVSSFSATVFVAFVVSGWLCARQARFVGVNTTIAWQLMPWAAAAGVLGSKLFPLIADLPKVLSGQIAVSGVGQVWYGGAIMGFAVVAWRFKKFGLPLHLMFDYGAAPVAIGHAIGRIGCFLVGDDYGMPTNSVFGMRFPQTLPLASAGNLRALGAHVPLDVSNSTVMAVLPTQLYEAIVLALIAGWLWKISRRPHKPWSVFAQYAVLYGTWRFLVEFVRVKDDHIFGVITVAQLLSVLLIAWGVWRLQLRAPVEASPPPLPDVPIVMRSYR